MSRDSVLPTLDVFDGLQKWGQVRLNTTALDNTVTVELRRDRTDEWKPLLTFVVIDGKIAFHTYGGK